MENDTILSTCVQSTKKIRGKWSKIFGGCILAYGSIVLLTLFPLFGIALAFFAMCFLCLGLDMYVLDILNDKPVKAEDVFSKFRMAIPAFCLFVLKIFYCALWGLLLIVPGIVMATNYEFSKFIMAETGCDAFTALDKSKELSYGYRGRIFLLFLLYAFLFVVTLCLGAGIAILINYFAPIAVWLMILITIFIALPIFLAFILPFAIVSIASLYLEAKEAKGMVEKKKTTKSRTKKLPQ